VTRWQKAALRRLARSKGIYLPYSPIDYPSIAEQIVKVTRIDRKSAAAGEREEDE